jgi:hypothetical protein
MRTYHSLWISVVAVAILTGIGAESAQAGPITVSSPLPPGALMSGTASSAFSLSPLVFAGWDVTSAFAVFNFVDDGELALVSSITTGPFFNSVTSNLYWNDHEGVQATLFGGESASAESVYFSFTNDYGFNTVVPCGRGCLMPFSQAFHDTLAGYTGGFGVVIPLGASSLAQLLTGSLPFTLSFDGDAMFMSDALVATLEPRQTFAPAAPVPEPATMALFGIGLCGVVGARRRRSLS